MPWATASDVAAFTPCDDDIDPSFLEAATEALWVRSGRQFGERVVTVRPCARRPGDRGRFDPSWGRIVGGRGWCACDRAACGCGAGPSEIELGVGPLLDVQEVRIDGAVVSTADYETLESRWLVYLADGDRPRTWPATQRLDLPDTEEGTWSVTARVGEPVPELGRLAAAELACELSRYGTDECRLSPNIRAETRAGVSYEFVGLAEALANGATGLPLVDLFVRTYNPAGIDRRARVLFPPPAVPRRTDTVGS